MELGIAKCAQVHKPARGKLVELGLEEQQDPLEVPHLAVGNTYKYLGIKQFVKVDDSAVLEEVRTRFLQKAKTIFATELSVGQKVHCYRSYCIGLIRYYFYCGVASSGRIESHLAWCVSLDTDVRKLLIAAKHRFRPSSVERLYVNRQNGGGGMPTLEEEYLKSVMAAGCYLQIHPECLDIKGVQEACRVESRTPWNDFLKILEQTGLAAKVDLSEAGSVSIDGNRFMTYTGAARQLSKVLTEQSQAKHLAHWRRLPTAGRILRDEAIDQENSYLWVAQGCMSSVNERNAMAVQENAIMTRCHPSQQQVEDKLCRRCHKTAETTAHVVSNCSHWLRSLYLERHNSVAQNLYWRLCQKYRLPAPSWPDRPRATSHNTAGKLLWDMPMATRNDLAHNRPDIVEYDNARKELTVWEVGIAFYSGLQKARDRKVFRYAVNGTLPADELTVDWERRNTNLVDELKVLHPGWKVKLQPVIVGTCGEVLPELLGDLKSRLGLSTRPAQILLERLQRSAVIGTSRVIKNHLSSAE